QILSNLNQLLENSDFLLDDRQTLADVALYPFVRQFAFVDKVWFDQQPVPALQGWLQRFLAADWFASVMVKLPAWQAGQAGVVFPLQPSDQG
ncbi:MAG: glutathione S-transferase C-terminal domain-containing protein, partial [Immundisolibacteraceae bacterium]|nr:glutathione S-transferase C-terminal domain-containing protein [Immundisolibacteraceae bacterium]